MPTSIDRQQPADPCPLASILTDFYREEFLKRQARLRLQREYYSEMAVANAEAALDRILSRIDVLCAMDHADRVVSRLLRCIDAVAGCADVADPKKVN